MSLSSSPTHFHSHSSSPHQYTDATSINSSSPPPLNHPNNSQTPFNTSSKTKKFIQVAVRIKPSSTSGEILPSNSRRLSSSPSSAFDSSIQQHHHSTNSPENCLTITSPHSLLLHASPLTGKEKKFKFQYVFPPQASQRLIYQSLSESLLNTAWSGCNCSIFTYGEQSSGKSYTLYGDLKSEPNENSGIVPRLLRDLFSQIERKKQLRRARRGISLAPQNAQNASSEPERFKMIISMVEVSGNKVYDVLNPKNPENELSGGLKIREHPKFGPYAPALSLFDVKDEKEVLKMVRKVRKRDLKGHVVLQLILTQTTFNWKKQEAATDVVSRINLVDLGAPERLDTSSNYQKEQVKGRINLTLATLGLVITKLSEKNANGATATPTSPGTTPPDSAVNNSTPLSPSLQKKKRVSFSNGTPNSSRHTKKHDYSNRQKNVRTVKSHQNRGPKSPTTPSRRQSLSNTFVPYRDSALTWLLRESLGGNSFTMVLACVLPGEKHALGTQGTLRFASRAAMVTNRLKVNTQTNNNIVQELRKEMATLHKKLSQFNRKAENNEELDPSENEEFQRIKEELEDNQFLTTTLEQTPEQREVTFEKRRVEALDKLKSGGISGRDVAEILEIPATNLPYLLSLNARSLQDKMIFFLQKEKIDVGTDSDSEVLIQEDKKSGAGSVRPKHAQLFVSQDYTTVHVAPVGDARVSVNGVLIPEGQKKELKIYDRILIAEHGFRFHPKESVWLQLQNQEDFPQNQEESLMDWEKAKKEYIDKRTMDLEKRLREILPLENKLEKIAHDVEEKQFLKDELACEIEELERRRKEKQETVDEIDAQNSGIWTWCCWLWCCPLICAARRRKKEKVTPDAHKKSGNLERQSSLSSKKNSRTPRTQHKEDLLSINPDEIVTPQKEEHDISIESIREDDEEEHRYSSSTPVVSMSQDESHFEEQDAILSSTQPRGKSNHNSRPNSSKKSHNIRVEDQFVDIAKLEPSAEDVPVMMLPE